MMKSFGDFSYKRRSKTPNPKDYFRIYQPTKEGGDIRTIGPIFRYVQHWIKIRLEKPNKKGEMTTSFPVVCLDYDHESDSFLTERGCPYCKGGIPENSQYAVNLINRAEQKKKPRDLPKHDKSERATSNMGGYEAHVKRVGSASWTPVEVALLYGTSAERIGEFQARNKHKLKSGEVRTYPVNHDRRGRDIFMSYNADKTKDKMTIELGEKTPLTEEEKAYLINDLDIMKPETLEEAQARWKDIEDRINWKAYDREDARNGKKKRWQDEGRDEVDDDDEDEKPKKKRRDDDDDDDRPKKKKRRDDDDEDDDDKPKKKRQDDDDDDERPKKKKKRDDDDDEDEDADDDSGDDDDDDDDERPKKKKKRDDDDEDDRPKKKKRNRDDDDDDDDSDDEDEDAEEDDE